MTRVEQLRIQIACDAYDLDTDAVVRLLEHGAPAGLPFIPPGAPA